MCFTTNFIIKKTVMTSFIFATKAIAAVIQKKPDATLVRVDDISAIKILVVCAAWYIILRS